MIINPVLLAGGSGTRLWPLSRKSYPKQFSNFFDEISLFQKSALRLTSSEKLKFSNQTIVTNSDFRFIVGEQLLNIGLKAQDIIIEPVSKNTAPAVIAACFFLSKINKNSIKFEPTNIAPPVTII